MRCSHNFSKLKSSFLYFSSAVPKGHTFLVCDVGLYVFGTFFSIECYIFLTFLDICITYIIYLFVRIFTCITTI